MLLYALMCVYEWCATLPSGQGRCVWYVIEDLVLFICSVRLAVSFTGY